MIERLFLIFLFKDIFLLRGGYLSAFTGDGLLVIEPHRRAMAMAPGRKTAKLW